MKSVEWSRTGRWQAMDEAFMVTGPVSVSLTSMDREHTQHLFDRTALPCADFDIPVQLLIDTDTGLVETSSCYTW